MSEDKLLKQLTESYNQMNEVFDPETGVDYEEEDDAYDAGMQASDRGDALDMNPHLDRESGQVQEPEYVDWLLGYSMGSAGADLQDSGNKWIADYVDLASYPKLAEILGASDWEDSDMDLYPGAGAAMGIDEPELAVAEDSEGGIVQPEINKIMNTEDGLDHQIAAFFPDIRKADILQLLDHIAPKKTESKAILDFLKYLRSRGQV